MKVDHTFAMTDGFSSISEGFFMERIIWNIIFHMKNNYYFLKKEECKELSENFFHANVTQLISKLKLLNLIRNICCHNGDLVDISLKTMPKVSGKYRQYLNMKNGNYPHRLAVVITVLLDLMYPLNDKYSFKHLERILNSLCEILGDDFANKSAQNMGFKNKKIITFYPDGSYIYK